MKFRQHILLTMTVAVFLGFLFKTSILMAQPIGPEKDIKPPDQSKKSDVSIEELDLPYKPTDVETDSLTDETFESYEDLHPGEDPNKPKKPEIDWSKIPFIPSKTPGFEPLPDPQF